MKNFLTNIPSLILSVLICFVLSSCSSTGVKMSDNSPWKSIQFEDGGLTPEEREELIEEGIDLLSIPWVNKDN